MTAPFGLGAPANTTQDAKDDWFLRSLRRLETLQRAPTLFGNLNTNGYQIQGPDGIASITLNILDAEGDYCIASFNGGLHDWSSLQITNQDTVGKGPGIVFFANPVTSAAGNAVGYMDFMGRDSTGVTAWFAGLEIDIVSNTAGAHVGMLHLNTAVGGAFANALTLGTTDPVSGILAHTFDFGAIDSPTLVLQSTNPGAVGPGLMFYANSASPAVSDTQGQIRFYGRNSANAIVRYGAMFVSSLNVTSTTEAGQIQFKTMVAGVATTQCMALAAGMVVGAAPTGGDKGAGTINVSSGIFLNNAAYTNPDYALEHYFTGKIEKFAKNVGAADYKGITPLDEIESVLRDSCRLPGIHGDPMDIFARSDIVLEKLEEAYLYIVQLHNRVAELEARLH